MWSWCGCSAWGLGENQLQTAVYRAGCVALILSELGASALLDANRRTRAGLGNLAVDHVKAILALIQAQLKVGPRRIGSKIHRPPLDVEDPVGCRAGYRGENTAAHPAVGRAAGAYLVSAQVVPLRHDRHVERRRRAADIAFTNALLLLTNWMLPLDEMLAAVKLCPYKVYGNGSVMGVVPSST